MRLCSFTLQSGPYVLACTVVPASLPRAVARDRTSLRCTSPLEGVKAGTRPQGGLKTRTGRVPTHAVPLIPEPRRATSLPATLVATSLPLAIVARTASQGVAAQGLTETVQ